MTILIFIFILYEIFICLGIIEKKLNIVVLQHALTVKKLQKGSNAHHLPGAKLP